MVSIILAIILVNILYRVGMFITGTDGMFFSMKTKIAHYIVASIILFSLIGM